MNRVRHLVEKPSFLKNKPSMDSRTDTDATDEIIGACPDCRTAIAKTKSRIALFGFRRARCSECGNKVTLPLIDFSRKVFIGMVIVLGLLVLASLFQTELFWPGWWLVGPVIILLIDRRLRDVQALRRPKKRSSP